ncbi:MAG: hypothetical protein SFX72_19275, partial [Isosphaeraceae bacterium]|nr:hypothetical protein [Isosphaeraceae bacterium]
MLRKFLAVVLMLGAVGVQQVSASQLYATTGNGGSGPSDLYQVDKVTGAASLVGAVGYIVNGMDYYNGVLYGVTSTRDPNHHGLIKIDTVTGAGTPIGTGWGASLPDQSISELAIDSLGNAFGWSEASTDDLASLDLGTGLVNGIVGDAGLSTAALS